LKSEGILAKVNFVSPVTFVAVVGADGVGDDGMVVVCVVMEIVVVVEFVVVELVVLVVVVELVLEVVVVKAVLNVVFVVVLAVLEVLVVVVKLVFEVVIVKVVLKVVFVVLLVVFVVVAVVVVVVTTWGYTYSALVMQSRMLPHCRFTVQPPDGHCVPSTVIVILQGVVPVLQP